MPPGDIIQLTSENRPEEGKTAKDIYIIHKIHEIKNRVME